MLDRRQTNATIADRLARAADAFGYAASVDLGLPVQFTTSQIHYAAECIRQLAVTPVTDRRTIAFLFPGNSEGALPAYILALAAQMGYGVEAKLSRRQTNIERLLRDALDGPGAITFRDGSGPDFLEGVLTDPRISFVQVYGDDSWIDGYVELAAETGTSLAFEGPGKDPYIVLEDADLDDAVEGAVAAGLFAGGAACMSPERFLVHDSLAPQFTAALVERLRPVRAEQPDRPDAVLGLHYSRRAVERISRQIEDAKARGGRVLLGGDTQVLRHAGRDFYACEPAVITDVDTGSELWRAETFGPVFPIRSFDDDKEAIALAEDSDFGLSSTVMGPAEIARRVSSTLRRSHGVVFTNATMLSAFDPRYWGSGGFRRSGWIDETVDGRRHRRTGFRPLADELTTLAQRTQGGPR